MTSAIEISVTAIMDAVWSSLQEEIDAIGLADCLYARGAKGYEDSISSYWSGQEIDVNPHYTVQPRSPAEVASVIKILSDLTAKHDHSLKFAIRGGGHQAWAGSANIQDGVTVDLRSLRQIELTKDRNAVIVGPGCHWKDVYNYLASESLTVPGARVTSCGVAGLTLGGK